jgi:hypothetical protein
MNMSGKSILVEEYWKRLTAEVYGFKYSRHRSKRVEKKLRARSKRIPDLIVMDEATTFMAADGQALMHMTYDKDTWNYSVKPMSTIWKD